MALIQRVTARAFTMPTASPEADGTIAWDSTTMVLATVEGGGLKGIGYSYCPAEAASLIRSILAKEVEGRDVMAPQAAWLAMVRAVRNAGRPGIGLMAIAAVDVALWDLKAKLLALSLVELLGGDRPGVPAYGSGGFTSYTIAELEAQLGGWSESGLPAVKMKVGTHPAEDPLRVERARSVLRPETALMVDANGAYDCKQALALAERFAASRVTWFEEPVSSDDLAGLRLLRDRMPPGMDVAAGEYGTDVDYFRRMLDASAVDVLQIDGTRCGGVTGFLQAADLAYAHHLPISAHTAPSLHAQLGCALPSMRHVEYFFDHVRIEHQWFDGAPTPERGLLRPDRSRLGLGLEFKEADAKPFEV